MPHSDRYLLFIEYFNKAKFTSAQMTLDEIWLDEDGPDRNYFGGLIQVAVALYHLTNDNPKGATKIFEKAQEMLSAYGEKHLGVNLAKLRADLEHLFTQQVNPEDPSIDYGKLIPRIEFIPEP